MICYASSALFCLQHSKTVDLSHAFLRVTIAELLMPKQVRFFGPPYILLLSQLSLAKLQQEK